MTSIRSLLALGALALGAAACDTGGIVIPRAAVGVWTDSIAVGEGITWANTLYLRPSGEFYWDQITYGAPPYGHDVPAYRTILYGRYRLRPGVLEVRTESLEHSGVALGTTMTERVANPRWSGDLYRARFQGDVLEIIYTTAPFDIPEEVRLSFTRQPPGRPID